MRSKIKRVWGKCDKFDVEFSLLSTGEWVCTVPPDTDDGQYAVEIFAYNEAGKTSCYTGILYMCSGVCHLEIKVRDSSIRNEKFAVAVRENVHVKIEKGAKIGVYFRLRPRYKVKIEKGCECVC